MRRKIYDKLLQWKQEKWGRCLGIGPVFGVTILAIFMMIAKINIYLLTQEEYKENKEE